MLASIPYSSPHLAPLLCSIPNSPSPLCPCPTHPLLLYTHTIHLLPPAPPGKFLSNAIKEADTDQDGRVSLPEFIRYYERLARWGGWGGLSQQRGRQGDSGVVRGWLSWGTGIMAGWWVRGCMGCCWVHVECPYMHT